MKSFYYTIVLLLISSIYAYSQVESIWIKITPKKSSQDIQFERIERAVRSYSNRIESNYTEIQNLVNQTFELYEERIYKGCGKDFGDYYYDKLTRTIDEINRKGIDYSPSTLNNIKYTFSSLQREMRYYDCTVNTNTTLDSYNKSRDYSDKSVGFPKVGTISKTTTLWDSCDWKVMNSVGKLNAGDYITIHSICETNISKKFCFVTLSNGKSAFVYSTDIEF
ncbi:hypothetical protein [Emticicia agri]|uniref:Uncharacterized protein n=1 Tax=Emticicia agri TaxID=2492393 RepID=A0A4Q5LQV1_9BACT|nr:hypothetical protein [Emticicia agri]RYU91787.1 hypothetical protein EWM59_26785 [Emticicia agri]